jgi:hypothetical protein
MAVSNLIYSFHKDEKRYRPLFPSNNQMITFVAIKPYLFKFRVESNECKPIIFFSQECDGNSFYPNAFLNIAMMVKKSNETLKYTNQEKGI